MFKLPLSNRAALELFVLIVVILTTLTGIVWYCWNFFWVPVAGAVHISFSGSLALALQLVLLFGCIWALVESKS